MKWKMELDALVEGTMAFAKDLKRGQPIPDLASALADTSMPIPPPTTIAPTDSLASPRIVAGEVQRNAFGVGPHVEDAGDKFRSLIDLDSLWWPMPTHVRSGIHHILSSVVEAHECENPDLPFGGPLPWPAKAVRLYERFWRHYG